MRHMCHEWHIVTLKWHMNTFQDNFFKFKDLTRTFFSFVPHKCNHNMIITSSRWCISWGEIKTSDSIMPVINFLKFCFVFVLICELKNYLLWVGVAHHILLLKKVVQRSSIAGLLALDTPCCNLIAPILHRVLILWTKKIIRLNLFNTVLKILRCKVFQSITLFSWFPDRCVSYIGV